MKRINHVWENIVSVDNGIASITEGTQYKRYDRSVKYLLYPPEIVAEDHTKWHRLDPEKVKRYAEYLSRQLDTGIWKHNKPRHKRQYCKSKSAKAGKWRDLYIPSLNDHIVAHMAINGCMKAFTRGMHPNCCGSVPGRGIKHVVKTVEHWMRDDKECRFFVKLDIRHFFDSIDKDILKKKLLEKIKDNKAMWVLWQIIDSAPVACPVGYYTSPWFSNLYLQDLDWFIEQSLYKERRGKRIKWVRHYLRYADDMLLIGTSESDLRKAVAAIQKFLKEKCRLEIKPEWEIKRIGKHEIINGERRMKPGTYWCNIGGYKFCKDATILREGIYFETKRLANRMKKSGNYTVHRCQALNSNLGWAKHCNSYTFIKTDIEPNVSIKATRKVISNVDKKRKQRTNYAGGS